MKFYIYLICIFFCLFESLFASSINGVNFFSPDSLFENRNYIQLKFNYLNKNIDPFNTIKDEISTITDTSFGAPGEMHGEDASIYFNILNNLSVDFSSGRDNYDFGLDSVNIDRIESKINLHKSFLNNFQFFISVGSRYIRSEDININGLEAINSMIKRIEPNSSVKMIHDEDGYWFDLGDDILIQSAESRDVTDKPEISLYSLDSLSWYLESSLHYKFHSFYSGIYARYGKTSIKSKIDTNIDDYVGSLRQYLSDEYKTFLDQFPIDLERTESYYSFGGYLNFPLFYELRGDIEYSYIKMLRDDGLDYEQSNYSLTAALIYQITKHLDVNFGAEYFYRQLNGVIPFMYNQYTQTTFDHKYGHLFCGISYDF